MEFNDLETFKNYKTKQISTHSKKKHKGNTKHKDFISLSPATENVVYKVKGPGTVTNLWIALTPAIDAGKKKMPDFGSPKALGVFPKFVKYHFFPDIFKNIWLKIYYDGAKYPSVNVPLGVFFGSGFGEYKKFMSKYVGMTAGGLVSNFHMPFRDSIKITFENKMTNKGVQRFYSTLTYIENKTKKELKSKGYFFAKYSESKSREKGPFVLAHVKKTKGHLVGMVLNTKTLNRDGFLNLEGDMEIYIDGEKKPSLVSTGTEDEFGGAWYYAKGNTENTEFYTPYQGLTVKSLNKFGFISYLMLSRFIRTKTSQYRFYPETVPFDKSLKCIIHKGENDEIPAHYNSVVYWYQKP